MEKLTKFFDKLENLSNCSYIIFEVKLQEFMLSLPESELVYSIVSKSLKEYDYQKEKEIYLQNKDVSKINRNNKCFIAFAFSLFYEIYNRKYTLAEVLDLFFVSDSFMHKYEKFKNDIVIPLKKSMHTIVLEMQKLYQEKTAIDSLDKEYKISKNEDLISAINSFDFKMEDRDYFNYFYNKLQDENQKEVALVAIKFLLNKYKNGEELLQKILEIN